MNKKTAIFILFAVLIVALGCSTSSGGTGGSGNIVRKKRETGDFNGIELAIIGNIVLAQGDAVSVEVETDDNIQPLIETRVEDGTLFIRSLSDDGVQPTKEIMYYIMVRDLDSLSITSAGTVTAGGFAVDDLIISIIGAGNIKFESITVQTLQINMDGGGTFNAQSLEASSVSTVIAGAGRCDLKGGKIERQTISMPGSGTYFAENLESVSASISIPGSGTVKVWATETLDVEIQGAGVVFYKGEPAITSNISGSGSLRQLQ